MEQNKKLSLQEEVKKEAEAVVREISDNPKLKNVDVSETMDKALLDRIRAYEKQRANINRNGDVEFAEELMPNFTERTNDKLEDILSEEEREALLLGQELLRQKREQGEPLHKVNKGYHKHLNHPEKAEKVFRMPRKKKLLIALVAIMVLVMGTSVTSVGSKSYLKVLWEKVHGGRQMQVANVSDMESKEIADGDELVALEAIREELNVLAVRFRFKPEDMYLKEYEIDKKQGQAILFYNYQDEIVRYFIYLNAEDSSLSQRETDDQINEFIVESDKQNIIVKEYKVKNSERNRFIALFEYEGINYEIKGCVKKAEIIELIKKLNYPKENP